MADQKGSPPPLPPALPTAYGGLDPADVALSPAATTVAFDKLLPPLRVPVKAGPADSPDRGEYLLAFQDEEHWRKAWNSCEHHITMQCEAGARMGCSLRATKVCSPPWWKNISIRLFANSRQPQQQSDDQISDDLVIPPESPFREDDEREACEASEMAACMAKSKDTCAEHSARTCDPVFRSFSVAAQLESVHPSFSGRAGQLPPTRPAQKHGLSFHLGAPAGAAAPASILPTSQAEGGSVQEVEGESFGKGGGLHVPGHQIRLISKSERSPGAKLAQLAKELGALAEPSPAPAPLLSSDSSKAGDLDKASRSSRIPPSRRGTAVAPLRSNVRSMRHASREAADSARGGYALRKEGRDQGGRAGAGPEGWVGGLIQPRVSSNGNGKSSSVGVNGVGDAAVDDRVEGGRGDDVAGAEGRGEAAGPAAPSPAGGGGGEGELAAALRKGLDFMIVGGRHNVGKVYSELMKLRSSSKQPDEKQPQGVLGSLSAESGKKIHAEEQMFSHPTESSSSGSNSSSRPELAAKKDFQDQDSMGGETERESKGKAIRIRAEAPVTEPASQEQAAGLEAINGLAIGAGGEGLEEGRSGKEGMDVGRAGVGGVEGDGVVIGKKGPAGQTHKERGVGVSGSEKSSSENVRMLGKGMADEGKETFLVGAAALIGRLGSLVEGKRKELLLKEAKGCGKMAINEKELEDSPLKEMKSDAMGIPISEELQGVSGSSELSLNAKSQGAAHQDGEE